MVTFTARRSKPEVVVPARATPRKVKSLSDVDNQSNLRLYATVIQFFRRRVAGVPERMAACSVIKAALAEALVYYYPVAGRLRELPGTGKKLVVDCTAEGVVFVEARADVRLEELGVLAPPYPCVDELLCDVGDHRAVVGKPLLYMQMTEFGCGGLAFALTMCHSLADVFGFIQLFKCIIDLARGEQVPTLLPTWKRHVLVSSSVAVTSPSDSGDHYAAAMAEPTEPPAIPSLEGMVTRSFPFGAREISVLRSSLPARLAQSATVFDLITAAVWRCRTAALEHRPNDQVYVSFVMNARGKWKGNPPIPLGFYGNAVFSTVAEAAAGELCAGPLAHAVELVRQAKFRMTDQHVRSVLDVLARGEHYVEVPLDRNFIAVDITRNGDDTLDLGWAEHVGGGTPMAGDFITRLATSYMSYKDANGEAFVLVPMVLPEAAMGRFASQITAVTNLQLARSSL